MLYLCLWFCDLQSWTLTCFQFWLFQSRFWRIFVWDRKGGLNRLLGARDWSSIKMLCLCMCARVDIFLGAYYARCFLEYIICSIQLQILKMPHLRIRHKENKKLHHRRPQTAAQIAHEILETSPEHGHGIPAKMGDKLGDKTGDNRKTKPGRRTQHPSQDGRQDRKQEQAKTSEADTASQPRQTDLRQHWEPQQLTVWGKPHTRYSIN